MGPKIAQKGPYLMELKAGTYYWCSCGHSQSQPFCNSAHTKLNAGMSPVETVIAKDTVVAWCGCKRTGDPPFCDSTHNDLRKMRGDGNPGLQAMPFARMIK